MRQLIPLGIVLFLSLVHHTHGQTDSTHVETDAKWSLPYAYIGVVGESAPVVPTRTNSIGIQTAIILKNHWQIGFYATKHTGDNYREQLIFPNYAQMNYKHGGLLLGYRTHLQKKYEFNLESKWGLGEAKWKHLDSGNAFLADKFQTLQMQASLDYLIAKFLVINAFSGYRWASGVNITGLTSTDFNGMYYGFMIKIGKFE